MDHLVVTPDASTASASSWGEGGAAREGVLAGLLAAGWRRELHGPNLSVWTRGLWPPAVACLAGGGVLVGERVGEQPHLESLGSPARVASKLLETCWGAYVAVWPAGPHGGSSVLRDPSGAREALIWRAYGQIFIASTLAAPGLAALLPPLGIARDTVARWLVDRTEIGGRSALESVHAVAPGALWSADAGEVQLWAPATIACAGRPRGEPPEQALRRAVDAVAAGWARDRPLIGEISGGLDSAITATALAPVAEVRRWTTFYAPTPEGDERLFARAVAGRLGVPLTEVAKTAGPWDAAIMEEVRGSARPALNAMDVDYDREIARQAREAGAFGVVTGQGGDAVFLNLRSAAVAAQRVARLGWRATWDPELHALAARLRTSVWGVMRGAKRTARRRDPWPGFAPRLGASAQLEDLRPLGPRHPWTVGSDALDPAKRMQVMGLAQALLATGDSRRARTARLLHLPLQQPAMEVCLGLSAEVLALGGADRPLARRAFADRLPPQVLTRRGKGDLTALYGRGLAQALPFVRDHLLGGELRRLDLLDPPVLEAHLTADTLMREGRFGDLFDLLAIEAWLRDWRGREAPQPA